MFKYEESEWATLSRDNFSVHIHKTYPEVFIERTNRPTIGWTWKSLSYQGDFGKYADRNIYAQKRVAEANGIPIVWEQFVVYFPPGEKDIRNNFYYIPGDSRSFTNLMSFAFYLVSLYECVFFDTSMDDIRQAILRMKADPDYKTKVGLHFKDKDATDLMLKQRFENMAKLTNSTVSDVFASFDYMEYEDKKKTSTQLQTN